MHLKKIYTIEGILQLKANDKLNTEIYFALSSGKKQTILYFNIYFFSREIVVNYIHVNHREQSFEKAWVHKE